jgi:ABC-type Fe3+/spermidine/putrescine transport system ATPase subunit
VSIAVELRGVRVLAQRRPILGPLDLDVEAGMHVVVLGPSGCGKTTLLRVIAGLARPSEGTLRLAGSLASDGPRLLIPCERRAIGMLFQEGALWPHMSAARTLDFVLRYKGVERARRKQRIAELLELVELAGFERRKPGSLSGGEAQRLALARALAGDPRLLLLDEPLGPLDAVLRRELLARIDDIQRRQKLTMIHVTHDPEESRAYADRSLRLEAGRLRPDESAGGGARR